MIDNLLREIALSGIAPSYVEQVSDTVTYIGYCKAGTTSDADDKWYIKKVEQIGTITKITYAQGSTNFNLKWSQRTTYNYLFRK